PEKLFSPPPGDLRIIRSGTEERLYKIYTPRSYEKNRTNKFPVLLVFHGGMGSGYFMEKLTRFSELAEAKNFLVVYPYGTGEGRDKFLTWNTWQCCGYALEKQTDDIGYVKRLIL